MPTQEARPGRLNLASDQGYDLVGLDTSEFTGCRRDQGHARSDLWRTGRRFVELLAFVPVSKARFAGRRKGNDRSWRYDIVGLRAWEPTFRSGW